MVSADIYLYPFLDPFLDPIQYGVSVQLIHVNFLVPEGAPIQYRVSVQLIHVIFLVPEGATIQYRVSVQLCVWFQLISTYTLSDTLYYFDGFFYFSEQYRVSVQLIHVIFLVPEGAPIQYRVSVQLIHVAFFFCFSSRRSTWTIDIRPFKVHTPRATLHHLPSVLVSGFPSYLL